MKKFVAQALIILRFVPLTLSANPEPKKSSLAVANIRNKWPRICDGYGKPCPSRSLDESMLSRMIREILTTTKLRYPKLSPLALKNAVDHFAPNIRSNTLNKNIMHKNAKMMSRMIFEIGSLK